MANGLKLLWAPELLSLTFSYDERSVEYARRQGFWHGVSVAAESIDRLYRQGGYTRPSEIANILDAWAWDLRKWYLAAQRETPLLRGRIPRHEQESWPSIRRSIIDRDQGVCRFCNAADSNQVHHVRSVNDGGLPDRENLVTLCIPCHRHMHAKGMPPEDGVRVVTWARFDELDQESQIRFLRGGGRICD